MSSGFFRVDECDGLEWLDSVTVASVPSFEVACVVTVCLPTRVAAAACDVATAVAVLHVVPCVPLR